MLRVHIGRGGQVRRSFVIIVFLSILRIDFNIDWTPTTWGFSTKIFTRTTISGICELSFVGITFHGKVNILLENSNDTVNQNHTPFKNFG